MRLNRHAEDRMNPEANTSAIAAVAKRDEVAGAPREKRNHETRLEEENQGKDHEPQRRAADAPLRQRVLPVESVDHAT